MSWRFLVAAIAIAPGALAGCGPGDARATTAVTWRFADDRRCAAAGAQGVSVTASDGATLGCTPATCTFACADGEATGVPITVPTTVELSFTATSAMNDPLYRGTLAFEGEVPAAATVTLYFTGGK